ncbi:DNA-3-methyladenine glycosylase I [Leeia sp.]|uniref:DNA-3-methyladenine glycosylase I n=1 Tax=Leeia sp. TaxID=2884678 RepID=UPI0035B28155
MHRCGWANPANPLYLAYHDEEWGRPQHDDQHLFEMLILEGAQAGLSWETILNKRDSYREAFDQFNPVKVARYDEQKMAELLGNPGIVRNRLKVQSAVRNAQGFLEIQREFGSFDAWLWRFVDGKPIVNQWADYRQAPARTELSDQLSKALSQRGFKFVGSTIMYAYMQATGMVDDHETGCHCRTHPRN